MTSDHAIRILLVDDNEAGRSVKSQLLRQAGWLVTEASDGKAGIRIARGVEHDIAVLDVQLPDEHGFSICRRLKDIQPDIMVLLTSASFTAVDSSSAGLDSGADAYLAEPAEDVELLAQVRVLLRMRSIERKLRDAEQRLEMALWASSTCVWDWDLASDRMNWSSSLKAMLGVDANAMPAKTYLQLVHPYDRERVKDCRDNSLSDRAAYEAEYRVIGEDGCARWISDRGRAVYDLAGKPVRMLGTIRDITAQKLSERAIRESEVRLRLAIDAASILAFDWSLDTDALVAFEPQNPHEIGITSSDIGGRGSHFVSHVDARDRQRLLDVVAGLTPERPDFTADFRMRGRDGRSLWMHSSARGEFSTDRRLKRLRGVMRNVTSEKQREEQVQFLMREVNHRSKNMLSLVLAVARQTVALQRDDFVRRFEERIQSLATSQDLLVRSEWTGVPLDDLVRLQLAHFQDLIGQRIEISGERLQITAGAAQTLGMALHELATNAGKYGALSDGIGRVAIRSRLDTSGTDESIFELSWAEMGGPPVESPKRQGFGSKVIGNMVRLGLNGATQADYAESGLVWLLRCPATSVIESDEADHLRAPDQQQASNEAVPTTMAGPI